MAKKSRPQSTQNILPAAQTMQFMGNGVRRLLLQNGFGNGYVFRPTQREALEALRDRLADDTIPLSERRRGYFEHATGLGKTALFSAMLQATYDQAARKEQDDHLLSYVVVPTTNLLHQTADEIKKFAPYFADGKNLGIYGDDRKDRGRKLTVITYASWLNLIETGQLNPKFANLIVFDEAHQNTSERREAIIDNLHDGQEHPDADSPQALCFAFTATAKYDEYKTVERALVNRIHEKLIIAGVASGELCDYIRTQNYVIRVTKGSKEQAWAEFAEKTFATGSDIESGRTLRSLQTAFYVNGTLFADQMAKRLNDNAALQDEAKQRNLLGVAVSIHSYMPDAEQKKRMEDYMAGKYMAVVGDEKFKAGWNYPPLKCIFDYQRGSLVDKAQIAGRGSRYYVDPKTGESMGLVLIDSIVYQGSDNEDEDAVAYQRMLAYAVTFNSLFEGTAIYRAGREPRDEEINLDLDMEKPRFGGGGISIDGGKVQSFVTLSEIKSFNKSRAAAIVLEQQRTERDAVSDEEHQQFRKLADKKGLGSKALFNLLEQKYPEALRESDLTVSKIEKALLRTQSTNLSRPNWELVMQALVNEPDLLNGQECKDFQSLAAQKGFGGRTLFKLLKQKFPNELNASDLTEGKIEKALFRTQPTRLSRPNWELVMQALAKEQNVLNAQEHEDFLNLAAQKGFGGAALFTLLKQKCPNELKALNLTKGRIQGAFNPQSTKLFRPHWELVMRVLGEQPDKKPREVVSDDQHKKFCDLAKKKGLGGYALWSIIKKDSDLKEKAKKTGLTESKLHVALGKQSTKLDRAAWVFVMAVLAKEPNVLDTQEHEDFLNLAAQKGLRGAALFNLLKQKYPKKLKASDLTESKISSALSTQSTKLSRPNWKFVMCVLREQPHKKDKLRTTVRPPQRMRGR